MGTFWLRPRFSWQNFSLSKAFRLDSTWPAKASCNSNTLKTCLMFKGNLIFLTLGKKLSIQFSYGNQYLAVAESQSCFSQSLHGGDNPYRILIKTIPLELHRLDREVAPPWDLETRKQTPCFGQQCGSITSHQHLRMALGLRPSCSALLRFMRRQAVAPSDRNEELAAVTLPP